MSEADERSISEQAEAVEPGSAEALTDSREAIDEAHGAARTAADRDLTDADLIEVEFDPADSGPQGAQDEAETGQTPTDTDEPGGSRGATS